MTTSGRPYADPLIGGSVGEVQDHPALRRLVDLEERLAGAGPSARSGRAGSHTSGTTTPRSRDRRHDRESGRPESLKPAPTTPRSKDRREPEPARPQPERPNPT